MFPPPLAIPPLLSKRSQAARNFLAAQSGLLLCALFLLVGLDLAGDYGWGLDEAYQRRIAAANWDYISGRAEGVETHLDQERIYGVAFELPLLLLERALGLEDYYHIHRFRLTLTHLLFIIGGYFCYRLAYRLFGNRWIALFALLFYLLHPRIYGHSFINAKDLPFLSMFSIALYLLERAFRRDTIGAFALLGLAVGLLTNLRIMGLMLFPSVIALRGLDWFQAGGGLERKRILGTAGLFALTAGLTLYAVTPYAWANPVDYLTAGLDLTVNHPNVVAQLFQGERIPSNELPPHYFAVWFGITTPPLILLLGGVGAAVVVTRAGAGRGAVFGNNGLRFALLLPACFLLPPLAAALLGSNQFDDWRHSYFLYAPFCLLAAGGLHWLAAAGWWRPGRAAWYALTAAGLGLLLLQMAQIHPLQRGYFNFLVDRITPERLRMEYPMGYWYLGRRAGLNALLQRHPDAALAVRLDEHYWDVEILPPATRQRLRPAGSRRNADYELVEHWQWGDPARPDLAFSPQYISLYANRVLLLRPLKDSRMTPAARSAYRELYRQAVAGEPIIRADYDVYLENNRLTFVREDCPPDSRDAWFAARSYPPSRVAADAPPEAFGNHGVRLGDICLGVLQLPGYIRGDVVISQSDMGKFRPGGVVWEELYNLSPPGLRERLARQRQGQPPAPPNAFEVFLDQDAAGGYRLLYAKRDCAQAEYDTSAFLHIIPENPGDLPFYRWPSGFANREFPLSRYGVRPGGECIAVVPLPDYPIAALRTGQAGAWAKNLYPPADPKSLRAAYAALSDSQPDARSDFDLYVQGNQLTYRRESCAATDTAARFFLHIIPRDTADLPQDRRQDGYANLDFDFARWGGHFDGKCLATVPLPDYPIAAVRTGQSGVWETNFYPPAAPDYLRAAYAALADRQPAAQSDFDLYVQGNRLTYWRESCAATDTAAGFFLHIIPTDTADLPQERRRDGYANLDFDFARWGGHFDGQCLATVPLPEYPVAAIRTGQAGVWEMSFYPPVDPDDLRAAYAALSARQPDARSDFALYIQDNRLTYLRESCAAADTAAGFFLHIVPVDFADLPQERQAAGFANWDFAFVRYGGHFDGKCLAAVPLPDYPIDALRTGQFVAGQGEVWAVELTITP